MWSRCCSNSGQVAAVELSRRVAAAAFGQPVPLALHRPVRREAVPGRARRREPVGEDLVDDRGGVPRGRARLESQGEVVRARHLLRRDAATVQPAVSDRAAGKEPAVTDDRVRHRQLGPPPGLAPGLRVHDRVRGSRLAVVDVAENDAVCGASRGTHPQHCVAPEIVGALDHVQLGAVVVRFRERCCARGSFDRLREAHPLTAPCGEPADDVALEPGEEKRRGNRREQRAGRERPPELAVVVRDEAVHAERQREVVRRLAGSRSRARTRSA